MQLIKSQGFEVDLLTRKDSKRVKKWLESKPFFINVLFYSPNSQSDEDFKIEFSINKLSKASKISQVTLIDFFKKSYPQRILANKIIKSVKDYESNLPTAVVGSVDEMTLNIINYFHKNNFDIQDSFEDKKILKNRNETFYLRLNLARKYIELLRLKDSLKKL